MLLPVLLPVLEAVVLLGLGVDGLVVGLPCATAELSKAVANKAIGFSNMVKSINIS